MSKLLLLFLLLLFNFLLLLFFKFFLTLNFLLTLNLFLFRNFLLIWFRFRLWFFLFNYRLRFLLFISLTFFLLLNTSPFLCCAASIDHHSSHGITFTFSTTHYFNGLIKRAPNQQTKQCKVHRNRDDKLICTFFSSIILHGFTYLFLNWVGH